VCERCGRSYQHRASLYEHLLRVHRHDDDRPAVYLCELCGATFTTLRTLGRHRHSAHVQLRPYACSTCGRRFAHKYRLQDHQVICARDARRYQCATCAAKFTMKSNLRRHERAHATKSSSLYACATCGRCFRRKHNMTTHARRVHRKCGWACSVCNEQFRSVAALRRHAATHRQDRVAPRTLVCDRCDKSFAKLRYLRMHQTVHAPKAISCVQCGRGFCRTAYLHRHRCRVQPITHT